MKYSPLLHVRRVAAMMNNPKYWTGHSQQDITKRLQRVKDRLPRRPIIVDEWSRRKRGGGQYRVPEINSAISRLLRTPRANDVALKAFHATTRQDAANAIRALRIAGIRPTGVRKMDLRRPLATTIERRGRGKLATPGGHARSPKPALGADRLSEKRASRGDQLKRLLNLYAKSPHPGLRRIVGQQRHSLRKQVPTYINQVLDPPIPRPDPRWGDGLYDKGKLPFGFILPHRRAGVTQTKWVDYFNDQRLGNPAYDAILKDVVTRARHLRKFSPETGKYRH